MRVLKYNRPSIHEVEKQQQGFSLVELSIVLVILGLLVGGIMTGQNLIHAAELRAITKEAEQYQSVINLFRDKYLAIPGDMENASAFWVEAAADCTYVPPAATGTQTCNGDGDGDGWVDYNHEQFTFWHHLTNAGLITGGLDGVAVDSNDYRKGENAPNSKFGNAFWAVDPLGDVTGDGHRFNGQYGHAFFIAGGHGGPNWPDYAIMTPEDAWNVDTKVDDGKPGRGQVVSIRRSADSYFNCTTLTDGSNAGPADLDADYRVAATSGAGCALFYRNAF